MARKIVVTSGKGGVGKSTVCKGLGIYSAKAEKKTLLIDGDAGLPALDILFGCAKDITFSWYDIISRRCEIKDALYEVNENLTLLSSPRNVLREDLTDSLSQIINEIEKDFDIIIIDAPAGLGRGFLRAVNAAELAIIVATADDISVKGATAVEKALKDAGVTQTRLLINRYDLKAAKKKKLLTVDEIIDNTAVQLIGIVPEDKNIVNVGYYDKKPKTAKSDSALSRISKRIDGKNVELSLSQLK